MCAEAKTNGVSSVSPDLNKIKQLLDEFWRRSAISESLTASGCSLLRMGVDSKNVVRCHMHLVQPRYEAVIAAGEGHVCFWTNLTKVN